MSHNIIESALGAGLGALTLIKELRFLEEADVRHKPWKQDKVFRTRDDAQIRRWGHAQNNLLDKADQLGGSRFRDVNEPPKKHDPVTQKK